MYILHITVQWCWYCVIRNVLCMLAAWLDKDVHVHVYWSWWTWRPHTFCQNNTKCTGIGMCGTDTCGLEKEKCCKCVHVLQNLYWYRGCININKYFLLHWYSKNILLLFMSIFVQRVNDMLSLILIQALFYFDISNIISRMWLRDYNVAAAVNVHDV